MTERGDQYFAYEPSAAFRGTRGYVHSTDLYEEILASAARAGLRFEGPIDFKIKAKIIGRPRYLLGPADAEPVQAAASCLFTSSGKAHVVQVVETDEPVTGRRPYDEGPAAARSIIAGRRADLRGPTGLRPIEAVTALAVYLHKVALPPPDGQRWMLGQLAASRPLGDSDTEQLSLEIDRVIGGTATRTRISAIDGTIGTMLFVLAAS